MTKASLTSKVGGESIITRSYSCANLRNKSANLCEDNNSDGLGGIKPEVSTSMLASSMCKIQSSCVAVPATKFDNPGLCGGKLSTLATVGLRKSASISNTRSI